ncbi:MAG: CBS domain-containing protein [Desulfobacterales bacterium]|jgi:CBS-domain-containing membrane protein
MKTKKVKDLMVPVSDYATVSKEATLKEALKALENENMCYGDGPYRHCSLVVVNNDGHVVGRLSQVDIMRALEPGYGNLGDVRWMERSRLSERMLIAIREQFNLWEQPVESMRETMEKVKVYEIMQVPSEGEFVDESDTLNVAMHRIVMGSHHSLLVTKERKIVGILRATDAFNALYDMIFAKE